MLYKKQFQRIAEIIAEIENREIRIFLVNNFSDLLKEQNNRFNPELFKYKCNVGAT